MLGLFLLVEIKNITLEEKVEKESIKKFGSVLAGLFWVVIMFFLIHSHLNAVYSLKWLRREIRFSKKNECLTQLSKNSISIGQYFKVNCRNYFERPNFF